MGFVHTDLKCVQITEPFHSGQRDACASGCQGIDLKEGAGKKRTNVCHDELCLCVLAGRLKLCTIFTQPSAMREMNLTAVFLEKKVMNRAQPA